MRKLVLTGAALCATVLGASNVLEFTLNSIDGKPAPLSQYHGKVVLIVNVASGSQRHYGSAGLRGAGKPHCPSHARSARSPEVTSAIEQALQ